MRAIAGGNPYGEKYFIVMDRLYDTMDKRILKWEKSLKKFSGMSGKFMDRDGSKQAALLEERLVAAFDLCAAICYLHDHKIIYRDIKPDNIGFDIRQDVKLFDFGLAKEITCDVKAVGDGTYKLTAGTGSIRYM
jgi:serine/threonine protein kinase